MSKITLTKDDAISLLEKSSLRTVLTEGITDYTIMRNMESKLSDLGVDFLPVGGRNNVLAVWECLSIERKRSVLAFVDLDEWLYTQIPERYQDEGIHHTIGYSIENDLFLDGQNALFRLLDDDDLEDFHNRIVVVINHHAALISSVIKGEVCNLSESAHSLLKKPKVALSDEQMQILTILKTNFPQYLRGKAIFETLASVYDKKGKKPKFGYHQLFHIALANRSLIFESHISRIRQRFI